MQAMQATKVVIIVYS